MFENAGEKLKKLALVVAVVGIAASVIAGFVILGYSAISGLMIGTVGCVFSWAGGLALYGFGELVDSNQKLLEVSKQQADLLRSMAPTQNEVQDNKPAEEKDYLANLQPIVDPFARATEKAAAPVSNNRKMTCPSCGTVQDGGRKYCVKCYSVFNK